MGVKPSTFLAVMVAANKGAESAPSRKSFPQVFEGFAQFHKDHPDSFLYVHSQSKSHLDLEWYAEKFGIVDCIAFAHGYFLHTGLYPPEDMRQMLNSADVLLNPSMGEGVGVPILEAQACGTPVITGDWTSMSEITKTGLAIPKEDAEKYTINNYGDMWMVHPEAIRDALHEAAKWQYDPVDVAVAIGEYEIDTVVKDYWVPAMEEVERRIAPQPVNRAQRRKMKLQKQAPAVKA
jgi:glycosyltransferase involved in cell wall biosynthesis